MGVERTQKVKALPNFTKEFGHYETGPKKAGEASEQRSGEVGRRVDGG